ncbi:MAG: Slp family lipoprotein [Smithellaceae bacterium]|nr:Slp family lipoprotein [Smithellaceae bacterium]
MKRMLLCLPLIIILCGCSSPLSSEWLKQAEPVLSFAELNRHPDDLRGRILILGGQIIGTSERERETWIEVLEQSLDWRHRPRGSDESQGRFLVRVKEFLDPAIYAPGRSITVIGEMEGTKVLPLKEISYTYPVLNARDYHLWRPEEEQSPIHFSIGVGGVIR